jgi:hypothetical protein
MAFIRIKKIKGRAYLYLVQNIWKKNGSRQKVVKYLGLWDGHTVLDSVVFARDENTCKLCGSKNNLTIDHIIPTSMRGEHSYDNVWTLCKTCNAKKGNGLIINGEIIHEKNEETRLYNQLQMLIQGLENEYAKKQRQFGKILDYNLMHRSIMRRKIVRKFIKNMIETGYVKQLNPYINITEVD